MKGEGIGIIDICDGSAQGDGAVVKVEGG